MKRNTEIDLKINGMHCVSCKTSIEDNLNSLKSVKATIDLKSKTAHVVGKDLNDTEILKAITDAGYTAEIL